MAGEIQGDAGLALVIVNPSKPKGWQERLTLQSTGNTFFLAPPEEHHYIRKQDDDRA